MSVRADQNDGARCDDSHNERISSVRTEALFLALTILFFTLFVWRVSDGSPALGVVFLCFCVFFLFYSVNYRTLTIHLTPESLKLKFGIFAWVVPVANIEECRLDELPTLMRYGGAGIHFMSIRGRYRASLNFLEYPRVVIALRRKIGPVRDISFTTRRPDDVLRRIRETVTEQVGHA